MMRRLSSSSCCCSNWSRPRSSSMAWLLRWPSSVRTRRHRPALALLWWEPGVACRRRCHGAASAKTRRYTQEE
ncbi:hypothetical protein MRX96_009238 [Rhipicephalus microplus]